MGLFTTLFSRPLPMHSTTTGIASPWSSSDSLAILTGATFADAATSRLVDIDAALRIPAVKKAYIIAMSVLGRMPWRLYDSDGTEAASQPRWLVTSDSGVPPRNLRVGVVGDLFFYGWALVGFHLDADERPADALHIPRDCWTTTDDGTPYVTSDLVPTIYTQRLALIQLGYGDRGILIDGQDTLNDARRILTAYRDRIDNPIPTTDLVVDADRYDGFTPDERIRFRNSYVEGRQAANGAVALRPSWVAVDHPGSLPVDLFESGRNSNRLDIANQAGVPASLLEGSKQSGGGDIHYSSEVGGAQRNELWDMGLVRFADAIDARMSLDDICDPGQSIRVDPSRYLTSPQPTDPPTSED